MSNKASSPAQIRVLIKKVRNGPKPKWKESVCGRIGVQRGLRQSITAGQGAGASSLYGETRILQERERGGLRNRANAGSLRIEYGLGLK